MILDLPEWNNNSSLIWWRSLKTATGGINDHCKPVASNKLVRCNNRTTIADAIFRQVSSLCIQDRTKGWEYEKKAVILSVTISSWDKTYKGVSMPFWGSISLKYPVWRPGGFNWVAVSVRVAWFLPVLVDGCAPTCHDETVTTVPSPGDGCEFWVTMKQSRWVCKTMTPARRLATLLTLSRQQDQSRCNKIW